MRSLRYAGLVMGMIALAGCADTTQREDKTFDTAAYYAQDFTCKPSQALVIDLSELERAPQALEGHCVRVTAYARGNLLYADANDTAAASPGSLHRRIGLDWNDPATARHLQLGPSYVTITGRVRLCSRRRAIAARAASQRPRRAAGAPGRP